MCKTCPIGPWIREPVRGDVCRKVPVPLSSSWDGQAARFHSPWASRGALVQCWFPQNITWMCQLLLSWTCFASFFLHWAACVSQFSWCERALKNIDHCCGSSSSSPGACPCEDGATVKPISGSPELLFTSMWGINWKEKAYLYLIDKKYWKRVISWIIAWEG